MSTRLPIRRLAATGSALTAIIAAAPALAAQEMTYEERVYEYAQPLPEGETQPVFVREPVVQPIPAQMPSANGYDVEYDVEYDQAPPMPAPVATHGPAGMMHPPVPHPVSAAPTQGGYPVQAGYPQSAYPQPYQQQSGYPPMPPVMNRDTWIDDCRAYLKERRRRGDRGGVIGGLLGAAAGGVIGNRVADSERLGGTLIGAGVGGLAGVAIGAAIGLAKGDPTKKECKRWLERYEDGGRWQGTGYPARGHGYGYGYGHNWGAWSGGYVVAPVTTVVVHHGPAYVPVVREIVTEEWVEEEVIVHKKVHARHPAPARKVRYIKQQPAKRIKYSKGK